MKFYSYFQFENTKFYPTIQEAIEKANKISSIIYSVHPTVHIPIRCIVNGRVYMRKHWIKLGFKNPVAFILSKKQS